MKFHDFQTMYGIMKRSGCTDSADAFYSSMWDMARQLDQVSNANRSLAEGNWLEDKAPYYNVYPSIIPLLTRLKLDIDSSLIKLPMRALLIRLPGKGNPLAWKHEGEAHAVRTILVSEALVRKSEGLTIWMDIGEKEKPTPVVEKVLGKDAIMPVYTYRNMRMLKGHTVENELQDLHPAPSLSRGLQLPHDIERNCVRLVCTLCLMADDTSIIKPDVLSKDKGKYESTLDPKYVSKALKRGKRGWNVGESIEVSPHYRRSHPAIVWTGEGRKIPKIVLRRATIVHREVIEKVPTGHQNSSD